jgi:hypothetical protein
MVKHLWDKNLKINTYSRKVTLEIFTSGSSLENVVWCMLFPTRLLTSEDECKWLWHQMIYFPGTINIVSTRLYCHIYCTYINNGFTLHLPAMHINLLCACWHSEAVKGSSSLSSRRLLISLWVTSPLFLCPELTDAPCPYYGGSVPPSPKWRPHSQGPHTIPFQGTRHIQ